MPFLQGNRAQIFSSRVWKPNPGTPINWTHKLAQGIVGMWLFNDTPPPLGITYDLSGNENHGTLVATTASVPGLFGTALRFDGDSDFVDCGDVTAVEGVAQLSIVLWVRTPLSDSANNYFVSKEGGVGDVFSFGWDASEDVRLRVDAGGNDDVGKFIDGIKDEPGVWKQIAGVYDGANIYVYVDGIVGGTVGTLTGATDTSTGTLIIGALDSGDGNWWNGDIDHVTIYNRGLTAAEVTELYADPFQMFF